MHALPALLKSAVTVRCEQDRATSLVRALLGCGQSPSNSRSPGSAPSTRSARVTCSPRQSASTSSTLSNRAPDSITPSCVLLIPPTSATSTCRRCWAARSRRAFLAIVAESVDATPARCPRDGHGAQPAGGMSPVQRAASPRDGSQVCVTGTDGSCILGITPGRFGPGRAAGPDSPPVSGAPGARGSPSRGRRWPTGATE